MFGRRPSGRLALFDLAAGRLDRRRARPWSRRLRPCSVTLRLSSPARITFARSVSRGTTLGLEQRGEVDHVGLHLLRGRSASLRRASCASRAEAALRQAALQRHLAAFEADLVEAARARLLALVAAARGLAQARPMPRPTRRRLRLLPGPGLMVLSCIVVAPRSAFSTPSRYFTSLIMPRTAGVSSTTRVSRMRRRPRPRTVARMLLQLPVHAAIQRDLDLALCSSSSARDLFDRLAALGRDSAGVIMRSKASSVARTRLYGLRRAEALGEHVA